MSEFTPKTRLEKFLAKIAGYSEEELEPKTRLEAALDDIAENIGQSGGSGNNNVFIVNISISDMTLDANYKEIHDAIAAGKIVAVPFVSSEMSGIMWLTTLGYSELNGYTVVFLYSNGSGYNPMAFTADTDTGVLTLFQE